MEVPREGEGPRPQLTDLALGSVILDHGDLLSAEPVKQPPVLVPRVFKLILQLVRWGMANCPAPTSGKIGR